MSPLQPFDADERFARLQYLRSTQENFERCALWGALGFLAVLGLLFLAVVAQTAAGRPKHPEPVKTWQGQCYGTPAFCGKART